MLHWFFRQANIGGGFLEHRAELTYHAQYPLALVVGLPLVLLAGIGIFLLQRRNLKSSPQRIVLALTACRTFILALLVVVLAGPFVRLDTIQESRPILALVLDRSQSMDLAAGTINGDDGRQSRAQLAHAALSANRERFADLARNLFDLKVYTFAREITPLAVDPDNFVLPQPTAPGGPSSRIGDAIRRVLTEAAGRPVAGIVVFSDGESTGGVGGL